MCLDYVVAKRKKVFRDYLKGATKAGYVICYGGARVGKIGKKKQYWAPYNWHTSYKKGWNVAGEQFATHTNGGRHRYKPYFHRFISLKGILHYWRTFLGKVVILKWKVNVKDISTVGYQDGFPMIVAKRAYLIGKVK